MSMMVYFSATGEILIFAEASAGILLKQGQREGSTVLKSNGSRYEARILSLFPEFVLESRSYSTTNDAFGILQWTVAISDKSCQTRDFKFTGNLASHLKSDHKINVWDVAPGPCTILPGQHPWPGADFNAWPAPWPK